jgi:hypothetical protein
MTGPAALLCISVRTGLLAGGTIEAYSSLKLQRSTIMGKYFLAWIMGVPAIVLVLIYLFFH